MVAANTRQICEAREHYEQVQQLLEPQITVNNRMLAEGSVTKQ